jgi:putative membrane-bound dehydrogenase-like protein
MAPRAIRRLAGAILLAGLFLTAVPSSAEAPPDAPKPPRGALAPEEELKTFQLQAGYQIQLAAAEPQVVDPVAMAFDEHGKLYVAELRVYPNEGIARNPKPVSRIVCLEDKNGDGVYETSTVFAEGLRIPNSVMPYKGGLIVCDAPDILYLEDTRKTGKADKKTVLYTGFDLANIQMLPNGLQLGLDNWIHCMGGNGGNITCPAKKEFGPVNTRGRNFRFQLEVPGSLEMESGGGQFGLAPDDAGNWFTATNAQHLRQIVFPDRALARNPFLALPATTLDISDHGPACQVFRISPFEAWRVERTSRRKDDPVLSKRLPATELVPGGFATSACSPIVQGDRVYVCDPANNLIIGERLLANGVPFRAKRDDGAKADFLASTDNWFRPTCLVNGPIPGAIYVADFYREVIETPLSLPEDIKQKFNLQSRDRGRIWCITPKDPPAKAPSVLPAKMTSAELVAALASENRWLRMTARS